MELTEVRFHAFKSLVGERLALGENCIGLVGRNESGKSNVLSALACLSPEFDLTSAASPRMRKDLGAAVSFVFSPTAAEQERLFALAGGGTTVGKDVVARVLGHASIVYDVRLERGGKLTRTFSVEGIDLPEGMLVRRAESGVLAFAVRVGGAVESLMDTLIVSEADVAENVRIFADIEKSAAELERAEAELAQREASVRSEANNANASDDESVESGEHGDAGAGGEPEEEGGESDDDESDDEGGESDDDDEPSPEVSSSSADPRREVGSREIVALAAVAEANDEVRRKRARHTESLGQLDAWDRRAARATTVTELAGLDQEEEEAGAAIDALDEKRLELEAQTKEGEAPSKELMATRRTLTANQAKATKLAAKKKELKHYLSLLDEPLRDKFCREPSELATMLARAVPSDWLPQVVFWEYRPEYILKGETDFKELRLAKTLQEIPRPLVNLFRIGLDVVSLDDLKARISDIRDTPGDRSRCERKMNERILKYLKDVWPDYDQEIRIALERDRIRVEFFDPKHDDASYYTMVERSQGCQTFLSFLLTVGAEAKRGVIRDTVLLLDEPETRLHPSGVRHMLKELITAARHGNKVVFATHSVFMIDRSNYDRHVIVKKEAERTTLQSSRRDRIGFFLQEEVLYGALDVNLNADFESMKLVNFVFEGDGDATLFERFHSVFPNQRPLSNARPGFYQGGKCSDIERYLSRKPIQLGSNWIFVLDSDAPAKKLRAFLEGKYRLYIGQCIFILQYDAPDNPESELEDLLPRSLVAEVIRRAAGGSFAEQGSSRAEGQSFRQWFDGIVANHGDAALKERFKALLNAHLRAVVKTVTTEAEFQARFPEYVAWASAAIGIVRTALTKFPERTKQGGGHAAGPVLGSES
jgi:hypothetical protein